MIKIKGIKSVNLHGGKMKKKIGIISTLIVMILVVILAILITNKKENEPLNFITNGSNIAYMYEKEDGGYEQGTSNAWSTGEYVLDIEDSSCNGEDDPVDLIDWDAKSNGVLLKANTNISCTLYFDRMTAQEKFFEKLLGPSGDGELLYHNSFLTDGANDHGYRYSGDDPNNFICFGPGSESYTGSSGQCPDENLYRIIGYIPVQLENGKIEFRIKVIKSEYATKEDLGKDKADGTVNFNSDYKDFKRVKAENSIDGFHWNDVIDGDYDNTWGSSTLYQALNSNDKSFLKNLNGWESKIEKVQWNVGGNPNDELPKAKTVYDEEWNESYGAQTKVSAKIGLMYPSDYGFASEPKSWEYRLYMYDDSKDDEIENNQNRENNWLFNGVYEWTISHYSDDTDDAFSVDNRGFVYDGDYVDNAYGVRPVFYLNSSVTLSGGNGIDGSVNNPYKVN